MRAVTAGPPDMPTQCCLWGQQALPDSGVDYFEVENSSPVKGWPPYVMEKGVIQERHLIPFKIVIAH